MAKVLKSGFASITLGKPVSTANCVINIGLVIDSVQEMKVGWG